MAFVPEVVIRESAPEFVNDSTRGRDAIGPCSGFEFSRIHTFCSVTVAGSLRLSRIHAERVRHFRHLSLPATTTRRTQVPRPGKGDCATPSCNRAYHISGIGFFSMSGLK